MSPHSIAEFALLRMVFRAPTTCLFHLIGHDTVMNYMKKNRENEESIISATSRQDVRIVEEVPRARTLASTTPLPAPIPVAEKNAKGQPSSGLQHHLIGRLTSRGFAQRSMQRNSETDAPDRSISASEAWAKLQHYRDDIALDDDIDANAQVFAMSALMVRLDVCMKHPSDDLSAASHLLDALSELKRILGSRSTAHARLNQAYSDLLSHLDRQQLPRI